MEILSPSVNVVTFPQYIVQTQELPEVSDYDILREANGSDLKVLDAGVYKGKQALMSAATLKKETIEGYTFEGIGINQILYSFIKHICTSQNFRRIGERLTSLKISPQDCTGNSSLCLCRHKL